VWYEKELKLLNTPTAAGADNYFGKGLFNKYKNDGEY
jgi:hypothetical protein